jgi:histone chaperone ASF1
MEGVEGPEGEGETVAEEDELSDDGSVDIEGESEDELLEEYEVVDGEGAEGAETAEAAEGDGMEVDEPETTAHKQEAMVH